MSVSWPHLYGLSWNLKRSPMFKTGVQSGLALGYETRVKSGGPDPIFQFELSYEVLKAGSLGTTLAQLEAFFKNRCGSYESFLLDAGDITTNSAESSITAQPLTIDANHCAPLIRTDAAGYNETIYELAIDDSGTVIDPVVKRGSPLTTLTKGVDYQIYYSSQTQGGSLNANGISYRGIVLKFIGSPVVTGTVYVDFGWRYRVRFLQDQMELDMFHHLLWDCKSVQLIGSRT